MKTSELTHPRQPIGYDDMGIIRFKPNKIINWMLDMGHKGKKFDLCDIVMKYQDGEFSQEDLVQLYQLGGYSITGFGDLSQVPTREVMECDAIAAKLSKNVL